MLYIFHFILRSLDYTMHVEGLQPANLCLVTSLSSVQCSQFETFRLQHDRFVNKTSSFKTTLIGNNAEANRVSRSTLWCL